MSKLNLLDLKIIKGCEYKGSDDWMHYIDDDNVYYICENNSVLGEIVLHFKCGYIDIYDFDIKHNFRGHGIGRYAIKWVLDMAKLENKKGITGESTLDAIGFWSNLGANFIDSDDEELSEDTLYPFIININTN